MSNVGLKLEVSEEAIKFIATGACFLGVCYLFYKLVENLPEDEISLPQEEKNFSLLPNLTPHSFDDLGFNNRVKLACLKSFDPP